MRNRMPMILVVALLLLATGRAQGTLMLPGSSGMRILCPGAGKLISEYFWIEPETAFLSPHTDQNARLLSHKFSKREGFQPADG